MKNDPPELPILITGGGIGGLAAALSLAQQGIASSIYERRSEHGEEGAGIQIGPNGMRILESLGLAKDLLEHAAAPEGIEVRDGRSGKVLTRLPLGGDIKSRFGAPYWTMHRQDLHRAMLAAAKRSDLISIRTGCLVKSAHDLGDHVSIALDTGENTWGSAVIAADGVRSGLRTDLFGGVSPLFSGKCAFRNVIPASQLPPGPSRDHVNIWLSPGAHVVLYPVRGGSEFALVAIFDEVSQSEGWNTEVEPESVLARAVGLSADIQAIIKAAAGWRMWALLQLAMPQHLSIGRMALLGDAAHPIPPFLAQGAVMALEDAAVLAGCLAKSKPDVAAALSRYERERRSRVLRVQRASRINGQTLHLDGAFAAARNATLRRMPPRLLMRQYDWLYGWQVRI